MGDWGGGGGGGKECDRDRGPGIEWDVEFGERGGLGLSGCGCDCEVEYPGFYRAVAVVGLGGLGGGSLSEGKKGQLRTVHWLFLQLGG